MRGARPELKVIEGDGSAEGPPIGGPSATQEREAGGPPIGLSSATQADLPPPPAGMPADMHGEWFAVLADLKARRLLNESMLGVVRSYVMAQWTAAQAEKAIAEQGVFVPGAGGAMKPNPATGLLRSSRDMIGRLAAELGLTPTARSRKALQKPASDGQGDMFDEFDL